MRHSRGVSGQDRESPGLTERCEQASEKLAAAEPQDCCFQLFRWGNLPAYLLLLGSREGERAAQELPRPLFPLKSPFIACEVSASQSCCEGVIFK